MYHLINSCLNNYEQFENRVDFNEEIVRTATSSSKSTTSKESTDISFTKERSKELVRDQITSSQHSTVPVLTVIKNTQKNLLEAQKLKRIDPMFLQLPLSRLHDQKSFW